MADAIVSDVAGRLVAMLEEQIRSEVNLVRGVEDEVRKLSDELNTIRNVLDDAEKREVKEKSVKHWLKKLEDTAYEMEDVLDEWHYAILKRQMEHESSVAVVAPSEQKVCSFIPSSCLCFKKVVVRHHIAMKIKKVKEQLHQVFEEKDRYKFVISQPTTDPPTSDPLPESWRVQSSSFVDLSEIHGRDSDKNILVSKLMANGGSEVELGHRILSITGVGGLGKTTLAQLIYNDSRVKDCFELRIWICVSDPFDEAEIAKRIIKGVKKDRSPETNQLEDLLQCVRESISGKKFLLVLDDVWTENYSKWEPLKNSLKCGGMGSKILVTTRNERVAKMMGTIENDICHLGKLFDEDCWLLLRHMALLGRNEEEIEIFQDVGKKIAKRCGGLPLAAKVLGSLLLFKKSLEEWETVLNSEIWQLEDAEVKLFPHLLLSYNELSPALKRCFSYCAVFPKDSVINVEMLIGNWMALGYLGSNNRSAGDLELRGREHFDILAMRSLFQNFEKDDLDGKISQCKMHDIVHDFAQFLRKNGRVETAGMKKTTCQACDSSLVSHVNEYRSLFWDKETPSNLCDCLTSTLRVLGLRKCSLRSIPQGMENLIHLRWLDLSHNYDLSGADLKTIFQLYYLQTLLLAKCRLNEVPMEIQNLIHLRWLDLSGNDLSGGDLKTICKLYNLQTLLLDSCGLNEIPREIGNLIHLRHLNLRGNVLKELPDSICGLLELRTLNIECCWHLSGLPQGIHRFINLKHILNAAWNGLRLKQFPEGIAQLTGLRNLAEFPRRGGRSKLAWLKHLNHLSGKLALFIDSTDDWEDVVKDAREAELRNKIRIQRLKIHFEHEKDEKESSVRMEVIDALEPHPNLRYLEIIGYNGFKFPGWISSPPLNQLRSMELLGCNHLSSLTPLGKLQCLEEIKIRRMEELQSVGREFLGITTTTGRDVGIESSSSSSSVSVGFPKLKKLTFANCHKWKEWEDITAEEEESAAVLLMPCLMKLRIVECTGLTALPHRLLHKASSLEELDISCSTELRQRYGDKDGSAWKSISQNNPRLKLKSNGWR